MSRASFASVVTALLAQGCIAASAVDDLPPGTYAGEFKPTTMNTSNECDSGQSIYLLALDGHLRAFDPLTKEAHALPALRCAATSTPNSMAVDSRGDAWIGYADGKLFRASPVSGECRATAFDGPANGWTRYGMGFVAERGGRDVLFIYDNINFSLGLARVDVESEKLRPIGTLDGLGGIGLELTGRGDGALFGLVSGPPTYIARIDPDTLHVTGRIDLPIAETASWAFAHWGGRFFVFTALARGHSHVEELTPGRGLKRVVDDLGFEVVGAGVSPCAPTEIR